MTVDTTMRQLRASATRQREAAAALDEQHTTPVALLRFYAAECALKGAMILLLKKQTISQVPNYKKHDLRYFMKELRMSPSLQASLVGCRAADKHDGRIDVADLHQAWRYGLRLHSEDEKAALSALAEIADWALSYKGTK